MVSDEYQVPSFDSHLSGKEPETEFLEAALIFQYCSPPAEVLRHRAHFYWPDLTNPRHDEGALAPEKSDSDCQVKRKKVRVAPQVAAKPRVVASEFDSQATTVVVIYPPGPHFEGGLLLPCPSG